MARCMTFIFPNHHKTCIHSMANVHSNKNTDNNGIVRLQSKPLLRWSQKQFSVSIFVILNFLVPIGNCIFHPYINNRWLGSLSDYNKNPNCHLHLVSHFRIVLMLPLAHITIATMAAPEDSHTLTCCLSKFFAITIVFIDSRIHSS